VRAGGVKVLEKVIIEFNKRFGNVTNVTNSQSAWLHQGNFTFFCDVIFITDLLHFCSVGCHFFDFFPLFWQEKVASCCLEACNVVTLPGIPHIKHDKTWVIVEELCVKGIDEVKGAEDVHTHYHTDDGTSDFMSTAAAALTTPLHLMSVKIAKREIEVWKSQTLPLPKTSNPLREWRGGVQIFPWLSLLAQYVLATPDISAPPERLFSTSGNTTTKKRCSLSCDNLEECVYLHETLPQVCKWAADKKVLDMVYFILMAFVFFWTFILRRGVLF